MLFLHIKALNAKVDKCGTEHADSKGFQFDASPAQLLSVAFYRGNLLR